MQKHIKSKNLGRLWLAYTELQGDFDATKKLNPPGPGTNSELNVHFFWHRLYWFKESNILFKMSLMVPSVTQIGLLWLNVGDMYIVRVGQKVVKCCSWEEKAPSILTADSIFRDRHKGIRNTQIQSTQGKAKHMIWEIGIDFCNWIQKNPLENFLRHCTWHSQINCIYVHHSKT